MTAALRAVGGGGAGRAPIPRGSCHASVSQSSRAPAVLRVTHRSSGSTASSARRVQQIIASTETCTMVMKFSRAGNFIILLSALSATAASTASHLTLSIRRLEAAAAGCKCDDTAAESIVSSSNCTCNQLISTAPGAGGESDEPKNWSESQSSSSEPDSSGRAYRASRVIVPQHIVNIFCVISAVVISMYVILGVSEKLRRPRCLWKERPSRVGDDQAIRALPSRVHVCPRRHQPNAS